MPVLSLDCHLPHNTPHIPSRYNNEQTTKQTKAINNSYIYIHILCKCDTNCAGHFTLDAYALRPVACIIIEARLSVLLAPLGHVILVAITGIIILVHYLLGQVSATHLKIGTLRWNLWVPNLQTSCRDMATWQATLLSSLAMANVDMLHSVPKDNIISR